MLQREHCKKDKRGGCDDEIGYLGGCPVAKEADIPVFCLYMSVYRWYDALTPLWFVGGITEETISAVVVVDERSGHAD